MSFHNCKFRVVREHAVYHAPKPKQVAQAPKVWSTDAHTQSRVPAYEQVGHGRVAERQFMDGVPLYEKSEDAIAYYEIFDQPKPSSKEPRGKGFLIND